MAESEGMKNPLKSIPKDKRGLVVVGSVAMVIVVYAWWRNSQGPSDASEEATAAAYDDGYVTQATPGAPGYTEGTGASQGGTGGEGGMPALRTNAEWTQYATEQLSAAGSDATTVQSALGKYLGRQSLNAAEQDVVRRALAVAGPPPVGTFNVIPSIESPAPSTLGAPIHVRSYKPPTSTNAFLAWDRVTGAHHYVIYRVGVSANVGTAAGPTFDVGGIMPDTSYRFVVRAADAAGKVGPPSAPFTVRTARAHLAKPSTPRVSQVTKSSVYLSWGSVPGATSYQVFRGTTTAGESSGTRFRAGGLKSKGAYTFTVAARQSHTLGPKSNPVRVRTK